MKILYIAAECKPFSKVGGVGDVAGELPPELKRQGVDIEIVTPLYGVVKQEYIGSKEFEYDIRFGGKSERIEVYRGDLSGVPVHFVKNPAYFEGNYKEPYINSPHIPFYDDILRFSFFSETCLHLIERTNPDIVHINDWPLGYLFGRMTMKGMPQKRILTYHNIGYQGNIGRESIRDMDIHAILQNKKVGKLFIDPRKDWKSVNAMRLGLELSDMANTVSPNYCKESMQPEDLSRFFEGGKGLHQITKRLHNAGKLIGIINGFEYKTEPTDDAFQNTIRNKAEMKKKISENFVNPDGFLLGFVGRAVEQKFRLLTEIVDGRSAMEQILEIPGVHVAILASGVPEYETFIRNVRHQGNYFHCIAFDRDKAKQISLGSDVFLMPSLFEPCGITQLESMSNATPPLVRWTGGLVDTVEDFKKPDGTGFGFDGRDRDDVLRNLIRTVREAVDFYRNRKDDFQRIQNMGFKKRFLWRDSAKTYIEKMYLPVMKSK
jgi:starch synthase